MKIGVDATSWVNRRGYGRYTRALLSAAVELDRSNEYTFFIDCECPEFPLPAGVEVCRISTSMPATEAAGADSHRSIADLLAVARAVRRANVDLIYFPTDYTYVPFYMGVPRLVTIHDTIFEQFPELVFPSMRSRILYHAKIRSGIQQARLLITVSEFSRRQLVKRMKIPQERLRVVGEAPDPIFQPAEPSRVAELCARMGIPPDARCLIYVGGFSPHKNLGLLIDVIGEMVRRDGFADVRLLLVGDYAGDSFYSCYNELAKQVKRQDLQEHVMFTGRMEDEQLVLLLNRARALVLPSFCEGFGLPAVEAAACGTPVLATTESPLPQLLREGALAIDPSDRVGWLNAIERVLSDASFRQHMSRAALVTGRRLSWQNAARQLLSVFDEVQRNAAAA
jgi:glycosyltransferase involved in cell wall biosynthesis